MDRPAGWYDVGSGWAAYWDGGTWTGDRINHQQLAAMTRPQAPPPPGVPPAPDYPGPAAAPARTRAPWGWRKSALVAGLGAAAIIGLIALGSMAEPEATTRQEALDDLATELRKECDTVRTSGGDHLEVTLDENDPRCAATIRSVLEAWDFTSVDVDRASRGQAVERGKFTLTAAGRIIQIDID